MNLVLLILRLLLGPLVPSWNEGVPLAVRRDGRLENRLHRRPEPQPDRADTEALWARAWRLLTQGVPRAMGWVGRRFWPQRRRGGS